MNRQKKQSYIFWISIITILIVSGWLIINKSAAQPGKLDAFAQCLAEKNITMYGALWCAHCQNEKKAFGSSFQYVPYVECPKEPKRCLEKGVKGYPTWMFPDGKKLEGEQGLSKIAAESGCLLPAQ